nr:exopolygalacturonase-like [Tanacetum cinerariifolium]
MLSFIHLLPLFFFLSSAAAFWPTFNVMSYGARTNRFIDNSYAFRRAWNDACASNTGGTVWIPGGNYIVGAVVFQGPCKGPVNFIIKGTLEASDNPANMFLDNWITFSHVDHLLVSGGGYLHGHGSSAWRHNDCATNLRCKKLPFTMRFEFVTNSRINYIQSIDSRSGHFDLYACQNMDMSNM